MQPELPIVENEIKTAGDNIPIKNVEKYSQFQSQTLSLARKETSRFFYDSDDQDFEPITLSISSDDDDDDEEHDLPPKQLAIRYNKCVKTSTAKNDNSTDIWGKKTEFQGLTERLPRQSQRLISTEIFPAQSPVDSDNHNLSTITLPSFSEDEENDLPFSKLINTIVEEEIPVEDKVQLVNQQERRNTTRINTHANGKQTLWRMNQARKIPCEKCTKTYTTKKALQEHTRNQHATIEQLIYKCEECPKIFSMKSFLNKHRLTHILKVNPLICDVCNRA